MAKRCSFFGVIPLPVRSICISPDERHLVSASEDYSVRIWDLKTNQQVGDPLLHDDQLLTVVLFPDGRYIASAVSDKKIYIWSLEAALKQASDQVRAHIAISSARSLISNRLCAMAMHSPTRSSR